jgi:hypothetical protein
VQGRPQCCLKHASMGQDERERSRCKEDHKVVRSMQSCGKMRGVEVQGRCKVDHIANRAPMHTCNL